MTPPPVIRTLESNTQYALCETPFGWGILHLVPTWMLGVVLPGKQIQNLPALHFTIDDIEASDSGSELFNGQAHGKSSRA